MDSKKRQKSKESSNYVPTVREELQKLAQAGKVTYYKDLGAKIGKPARWSLWKLILDEISYKKPDLSILVLNSSTGWPGQINYKPTRGKPDSEQRIFAQLELEKVFENFCPGKPIPMLPIKRNR